MADRRVFLIVLAAAAVMLVAVMTFVFLDPYAKRFDAEYVGSETCGECHTLIYDEWQRSPHANMTRRPTPRSVVGNFDGGTWTPPLEARADPDDESPVARMYRADDRYYMAMRHPRSGRFVPFEIAYVIGYQYRQVYLTRERDGVLRRLPLQWSVERQEFFPYWNLQEGSTPTLEDLWIQTGTLHSAWNLYCARCHTTHLTIHDKDERHRRAVVDWIDDGIACEACHGPGSMHTEYFGSNYANRLAAFLDSKLRGRPAAYIANARKLDKGRAMSVCARCHGADIWMTATDVYRIYEPGYSREGRTNDLSAYFTQTPIEPGREQPPTVEVYADGEPKGIGMLFRSLVESACYREAEIRCFDCHNPHDNKQPAAPGILQPSEASDDYCLQCHGELASSPVEHTGHPQGTPGSYCYDCHMPKMITKLATGVLQTTRTHKMSTIPDPVRSARFGLDGSPNACNECHVEKSHEWAREWLQQWFGDKYAPARPQDLSAISPDQAAEQPDQTADSPARPVPHQR